MSTDDIKADHDSDAERVLAGGDNAAPRTGADRIALPAIASKSGIAVEGESDGSRAGLKHRLLNSQCRGSSIIFINDGSVLSALTVRDSCIGERTRNRACDVSDGA